MTLPSGSPDEPFEFQFLSDTVIVRTSSEDTGGSYAVLDWSAAPDSVVPIHHHEGYEETFVMLSGLLEVTLGSTTTTIGPGQSVHVPQGASHSYRTLPDTPARMLLIIRPAGLEELFYRFRDNGEPFDVEGYLAVARNEFATEYQVD
ncbi:MAG: cupin domain-containing protein [Actinomycetota bacterium]